MARCDECGEGVSSSANFCENCGAKIQHGCFIATACYGIDSDEVKIFRQWRDNTLLINPFGKRFVNFYYIISPSIANFISDKPLLKSITRWGLFPLKELVK